MNLSLQKLSRLSLVGQLNGRRVIHWPRLLYRALRHALGAALMFLLLYSLWFLLAGPGFMGILDTWADPSFFQPLRMRLLGFVVAVLVLSVGTPLVVPFFAPLENLPPFDTLPPPSRFERLLPFSLACLVTLVALFYTIENWRGKRTWEGYKRQMEARGERLEFSDFIPRPVPDAENFAMTPVLAPLSDLIPGTRELRDPTAPQRFLSSFSRYWGARLIVTWQGRSEVNSWHWEPNDWLIAWDAALSQATNATAQNRKQRREARSQAGNISTNLQEAARGVLAGLSESRRVIEELRSASRQPYSRFHVPYHEELLPFIPLWYIGPLHTVTEVLRLRASAELVLDQVEAAFEDLGSILDLGDATQGEPFRWSYTERMRNLRRACSLLAEGLAMRQWSEAQLRILQDRLNRLNLLAEARYALEAERVISGVSVINQVRRSSHQYELINQLNFLPDSPRGRNVRTLLPIIPAGWFYLEQVNFSRHFQDNVLSAIDMRGRQITPPPLSLEDSWRELNSRSIEFDWLFRHELFWQTFRQNRHEWERLLLETAFTITGVDAAILACALERYRRDRGQFPDSLNALVPEYLQKVPRDIVTREPLIYRPTQDGQFILYSTGWDGTDDGGRAGRLYEEGDWVWSYEGEKGVEGLDR